MFKNLDELENRLIHHIQKKTVRHMNSECHWGNCAVGCRLRELNQIPKGHDNDNLYFLLNQDTINIGMDFNRALQTNRPDKALRIIKELRKKETGFFK